jgi:hypothetical protein
MPQLIRNIQGEIHTTPVGEVMLVKDIKGEIQFEDYISINGFVAYLQNLKKTEYTEALINPYNFGLVNKYNIPMVTIEISY